MALVIPGGREGMRTAMYGTMNRETVDYIQSRINSLRDHYGDAIVSFQQSVQDTFNKGALRAINMAKNALGFSGDMFNDGIRTYRTQDEFRYATPMNQLYLSCAPFMQREIRSGRLEGWGVEEKYPQLTGIRNPIYQSVMQGVLQYSDENGRDEDIFQFYYNDEVESEKVLETHEKIMIRQNWNRLYNMINSSEEDALDPTSISGAYL